MKKEYYEKHRERFKALSRENYHKNKEVRRAKQKEWRDNNKEKFQQSRDNWLNDRPGYTAWHNAKRRAKEKNIPFTIHWSDIEIPTHCPILGIKLNEKEVKESCASIDRIIPSLGYTKENIRIISMRANRIKSDGTAEEHLKIAEYIKNESLKSNL